MLSPGIFFISALLVLSRTHTSKAITFDCSSEKLTTTVQNAPLNLTHKGNIIKYEHVLIGKIENSTNLGLSKKYINAKLEAGNLLIYTTNDFANYARDQSATSITLELHFGCADKRGRRTLIFKQPILAHNYYAPVFAKPHYDVHLPTPVFAGFELTSLVEIAARDNDLINNRLVFNAVNVTKQVITVDTKKETDATGKVYYASLFLTQMHLTLDKPIEFTLCALDAGLPKRNATTHITIRADSKRRLPPMPRFEQSVYHVSLELDLTLKPLKVHLVRSSVTKDIRYQLDDPDSKFFNISVKADVVEVVLAEVIDYRLVRNRSCLHFTILAGHKDFNDTLGMGVAKAMAIVVLPNLDAHFQFSKPMYTGSIDNGSVLMAEPITFSQLGSGASVNFSLNGSQAESFTLSQQQNILQLQLIDQLDHLAQNGTNASYIMLDLLATADANDLHALSSIVLKLPEWQAPVEMKPVQPKFQKPLYRGKIFNETGALELEPIAFDVSASNATNLTLVGDQQAIFDYEYLEEGTIKLRLLQRPKSNASMLLLTLEARNGRLKDCTTIALAVIGQGNETNCLGDPFMQTWLTGQILRLHATHALYLPTIQLKDVKSIENYEFNLFGDKAEHFALLVDLSMRKITLKLKKRLANDVTSNRTELILQIRATCRNNPELKNDMVLFVQLPSENCLEEMNALLPQTPMFSSAEYVFNVQPNVTGIIGLVSAFRLGNNNVVRYSMIVKDPQLRKRLTINSYTGELSLLSYAKPGIYYVKINAQDSISLAQASVEVTINVALILKCYKDERPEVSDALLVKYIEEERAYAQLLDVRLDEFCQLVIKDFVPNDKPYVYINETTHMLATIPIDRESQPFSAMSIPALHVRLMLQCPDEQKANEFTQLQPLSLNDRFINDIPYFKDVTVLKLYIVDVNDNAPQFVYPANNTNLAYPATEVSANLFPEFLVQVRAVDADQDTKSSVSYSMQANTDFEIDAQSGIVYPKPSAPLLNSFARLQVTATDAGGLSSEISLDVHRLTADHYMLLTLADVAGGDRLTEVLSHMYASTGVNVTTVKHATTPRLLKDRTSAKGGQVVQQLWCYAFKQRQAITVKDLQAELRTLGLYQNDTVLLQSLSDMLNQRKDNDDSIAYILAIGFLALVSMTCIIFFIYSLNCCSPKEKTSANIYKLSPVNQPESSSDGVSNTSTAPIAHYVWRRRNSLDRLTLNSQCPSNARVDQMVNT